MYIHTKFTFTKTQCTPTHTYCHTDTTYAYILHIQYFLYLLKYNKYSYLHMCNSHTYLNKYLHNYLRMYACVSVRVLSKSMHMSNIQQKSIYAIVFNIKKKHLLNVCMW